MTKKILIISKCPTHPINAGNRKGILNQVNALKSLGNEIYMLYINEPSLRLHDNNDILCMKEYWGDHLFVYEMNMMTHIYQSLLHRIRIKFNEGHCKVDDYYPHGLSCYVDRINSQYNFDVCIVNYYYLSKLFTKVHFEKEAVFTHDYFAYKGLLVNDKGVGYNTTAHEEAKALQRAGSIFSVNTEESHYFQRLSPQSKIYNIFSHYDYLERPYCGNSNLLYLSGDNEYNINGLKWFVQNIWPTLVEGIPNIKLIVAGGICKKIKDFESPNIKLLGYIEDPSEFFNLGDIVINPTYQGTGLKIKTFEGIASDKVTIAHPHSIEGVFDPVNVPVFTSTEALSWLDYLKSIMCNKDAILDIKKKNRMYIARMNNYIEDEYKRFLS